MNSSPMSEYNQNLEDRLRQVELAVCELASTSKLVRAILIVMCGSIGLDISGVV